MTVAINAELVQLADEVLGSGAPGTGFDAALWVTLEDTGLARLTLPADVGGSEASFADAAVVLAAAGAHAARVPLVETDLLAGWLLQAAGIPLPEGPLTLATGDLDVARTVRRAAGILHRVPWARAAAGIVVLAGDHALLIDPADTTITDGANLAEEPRDTVVVDGPVTASSVEEHVGTQLRLRAALGRSQLLVGRPARRTRRLGALRGGAGAVRPSDRTVPGRPAAVGTGRRRGRRGIGRGGRPLPAPPTRTECSAPSCRSRWRRHGPRRRRGVVAGIAHQVHGAYRVHPRARPAPRHHPAVGVARRGRLRGAVAGGDRGGRAGGGPRGAVAPGHRHAVGLTRSAARRGTPPIHVRCTLAP